MRRALTWAIVGLPVLIVAFFLFVPLLARHDAMGSGSYKYARQWRAQLLACQSLDDVKQRFNCIEFVPTGGGGARMVHVTADVTGRPQALIDSFPDGKWIACAYASSHGTPGGGTIVSRDSEGEVHVFFGHVCGRPHAWGNTLEEFYVELRDYNGIEEKSLPELE